MGNVTVPKPFKYIDWQQLDNNQISETGQLDVMHVTKNVTLRNATDIDTEVEVDLEVEQEKDKHPLAASLISKKGPVPYNEIIDYLNLKGGKLYKRIANATQENTRTMERRTHYRRFQSVIEVKCGQKKMTPRRVSVK